MIIFFGPPGSGKSMQGKIMATRHGLRWISVGELLRKANNPTLNETMKRGDLVDKNIVNELFFDAIGENANVVVDGYPRNEEQAKDFLAKYPNGISAAVVLDVSEDEIKQRLLLRKRAEDEIEVIAHRIELYNQETQPILDYFIENGIKVEHIDGVGLVGEIHDRIEKKLEELKIVESY